MPGRIRAAAADWSAARLRSRVEEGRPGRRSLSLVPLPASGRHRKRPLVVHDLADANAILIAKARRIGRQVGTGRHAALHRRPLADFIEPALEILELLDVLPLRL